VILCSFMVDGSRRRLHNATLEMDRHEAIAAVRSTLSFVLQGGCSDHGVLWAEDFNMSKPWLVKYGLLFKASSLICKLAELNKSRRDELRPHRKY